MTKKILISIVLIAVFMTVALPVCGVAYAHDDIGVANYTSRSSYLVDYDTNTVIIDKNSDERYPIASMVKIMTLLLTFREMEKGNLNIDEKIVISEYASSMGGSQMFLEQGEEYAISDLIKGVTVCSANDAATALGERISGNIENFVKLMNDTARDLGMENTLFCNATGLPNSGEQYSSAKDVTVMMRNLLVYDDYYQYSSIWMEEYTHPDGRITEMVNTNKLIRFYKNCDSGKTGFTNEAKFCLSASAKKGDMRVIGTVLGADDSKTRFREMTDMFNYAFSNYETRTIIKKGEIIPNKISVNKAKDEPILLYVDRDIKYFIRIGLDNNVNVTYELYNLTAPVSKETPLGKVTVLDKDGKVICEGNIYSLNGIKKQTYRDAIDKVIKNWLS